jgi:hypothetical protein
MGIAYNPKIVTDKLALYLDASNPKSVKTVNRNLLVYPEDFSNAIWIKSGGTVVESNSALAPDGTLTADKVTFGPNNGSQLFQRYANSIINSHSSSIWVRADSSVSINFGGYDAANVDTVQYNIGTSWQRVTYTRSTTLNASGDNRMCWMYSNSGVTTTVYVWGAQSEPGSTVNDYVPVSASSLANTWYDISGNGNNCVWNSIPVYSAGYFKFNGTNSGTITNNSTLDFSSEQTLIIVMRHTDLAARRNPWDQAYGGFGTWTHENGLNINYYYGNSGINDVPYTSIGSTTTPVSVWNVMCSTRNTTQSKWFSNGALTSTLPNPYGILKQTTGNITVGAGYAGSYLGDIAMIMAYTRALSDTEVTQNYNAIRGRLNL